MGEVVMSIICRSLPETSCPRHQSFSTRTPMLALCLPRPNGYAAAARAAYFARTIPPQSVLTSAPEPAPDPVTGSQAPSPRHKSPG